MKYVIAWAQAFALSIGGLGLFFVAFIDASVLSLPEINDILIVYMVTKSPSYLLYYAAMATAGSIGGSLVVFYLGRKGGEALLRKQFSREQIDRMQARFTHYAQQWARHDLPLRDARASRPGAVLAARAVSCRRGSCRRDPSRAVLESSELHRITSRRGLRGRRVAMANVGPTEFRPELAPGTRVGHYTIVGELGRGGLGVVYRARDDALGRDVALKSPLPDHASEDDRHRFLVEARAAARLSHPAILPTFEAFEDGDRPWLAMALADGRSLRAGLLGRRALPLEEVLSHAESLADALDAAHAKHVLHRDVTPNNIFLTPEGRVVLMDFGLARATEPRCANRENGASGTRHGGLGLGALAFEG